MKIKDCEEKCLAWHADFKNPHKDITDKENDNIICFLEDVFAGKVELCELEATEQQ